LYANIYKLLILLLLPNFKVRRTGIFDFTTQINMIIFLLTFKFIPMKKILLVCFVTAITLTSVFAQVPQAFHYQAIARDEAGNPLINRDIGLRISILQHDQSGPVIYSETHRVQTGPLGFINLNVGRGSVVYGRFSDIDWAGDNYYLLLEMDSYGGANYRPMGVSGLYSVPYALCAGTLTDNGSRSGEWTNDGINIYVDAAYSANNVGIGTTSPTDKLHVYGGTTAANLMIESNISTASGAISRFRLKNSADGDLFNLSLRRTSGNTEMLQSLYDASATTWREYVYFNVNTQKYEVRSGVGKVEFKNSGDVLFNNSGNIGIGVASAPTGQLTIQNTGVYLRVNGANNLFFKDVTGPEKSLSALAYDEFTDGGESRGMNRTLGNNDAFDLGFKTNALERIHLESNGNIGIGTTNPSEFVHVLQSTTTANPKLLLENPGNGDASMEFKRVTTQYTMGLDYDDDINFEISNTGTLTGSGGSDYTDANTMMRINRTNAGIVDFNHTSRARAFLSDTTVVVGPTYLDYYGRGWYLIPFDKDTPIPGFDEHNEFSTVTSQFTALEEGYYQVNARSEIIPYGIVWEDIRSRQIVPPFPVVLSIGIFVNGQLYAQGNNYELNYLTPGGEYMWYQYMNAPNVSDVVDLIPGDYVEICLLVFSPIWVPPFPSIISIVGDDHGVFTYFSIHKVS
jgi:hypothetical protein